jgi:peptidoglycan/LPS O-acetylase OafA/YrhL
MRRVGWQPKIEPGGRTRAACGTSRFFCYFPVIVWRTPLPAPSRRLETLDALRGLAATAVVASHLLHVRPAFGTRPWHGPMLGWEWALKATPLSVLVDGHAAVLVFFVLSGLVLSGQLLAPTPPRYGAFAVKRLLRLYPPYAAALLGSAALQTWLGAGAPHGPSGWLADNWTERFSFAAVADYALMLGDRLALDNPVWSLDYEMRISLLLPLLLLPVRRWRPAAPLLAAGLLGAGWLLRPCGAPQAVWAGVLYAGMFLLGTALADQVGRLRAMRPGWPALAMLAGAWAVLFLVWQEALEAVGAAMLVASVLMAGAPAALCETPVARFLGRISFSLYLVHVPVLMAVLALLGTAPFWRMAVVFVPVSLAVAWAFHRIIERPSHALSRRWPGRTRAEPAALANAD